MPTDCVRIPPEIAFLQNATLILKLYRQKAKAQLLEQAQGVSGMCWHSTEPACEETPRPLPTDPSGWGRPEVPG